MAAADIAASLVCVFIFRHLHLSVTHKKFPFFVVKTTISLASLSFRLYYGYVQAIRKNRIIRSLSFFFPFYRFSFLFVGDSRGSAEDDEGGGERDLIFFPNTRL